MCHLRRWCPDLYAYPHYKMHHRVITQSGGRHIQWIGCGHQVTTSHHVHTTHVTQVRYTHVLLHKELTWFNWEALQPSHMTVSMILLWKEIPSIASMPGRQQCGGEQLEQVGYHCRVHSDKILPNKFQGLHSCFCLHSSPLGQNTSTQCDRCHLQNWGITGPWSTGLSLEALPTHSAI